MNIVGHKDIITFLKKSIKDDKITHAYLFCGPPHIGKKTVALKLAIDILKNKCENIQEQILQEKCPDIVLIKKENSKNKITINQIRQLKESLNLTPLYGSYKIAIIENAQDLTLAAANSFLKLLEEPPLSAIIILITENINEIPWTIRSRMQILRFSAPKKKAMINFLNKNFNVSCEKAEKLLSLSTSQPGLAINFLKNPNSLDSYFQNLSKIIKIILDKKIDINGDISFRHLSQIIRDLILIKLGIEPSINNLKRDLTAISKTYDKRKLINLLTLTLLTKYYLSHNVNKKLAIENLLINIS